MITVAVVNLKGGTGKTTTAGFLAHVWHERGRRVLLVDADPQASAARWSEDAEWPIPVVQLASPRLHVNLPGIVSDQDVVVIDTPPSDSPPIVTSALRVATHVVVAIPPNPADQERLGEVAALLDDVATLRRDGRTPPAAVLLTRVDGRTAAPAVYREVMTESGWQVLRAEARAVQRFAQAVGSPIERAAATAYGDAADELEQMTQEVAS